MEVDEAGVSRLRDILKENKTLAEDLSKAFSAARASLKPLLTTTATEALNSLKTSGARPPDRLFLRSPGRHRRRLHRGHGPFRSFLRLLRPLSRPAGG